ANGATRALLRWMGICRHQMRMAKCEASWDGHFALESRRNLENFVPSMINFLIRRVFFLIPLLLGITFLVSFLMSLAPGDFLTEVRAQRDISPEYIAALEDQFGLNQPWYVQYFLWLKNALTLNLGYSWTYKVPVIELLGQRLLATFLLSLCAVLLAWSIAIPLGVLAAVKRNSIFDRISSALAYAALSLPEFFLALIAVYFAARTGWFPIGGFTSIEFDYLSLPQKVVDIAYHLILPSLVLGIGSIAGIMRIMRANFLDHIRSEYVTTARAKGLDENKIMFKHVLRNAINPLLSAFGLSFSSLLSGALIVEIIMNYPGLGQLIYQSILREDQFVVMAAVLLSCTMLVIGNLIADILLAASDPRIRLESSN
ncbi:MAG: ABC transporter permease, partial [Verrucomicrobiota bacterium]